MGGGAEKGGGWQGVQHGEKVKGGGQHIWGRRHQTDGI